MLKYNQSTQKEKLQLDSPEVVVKDKKKTERRKIKRMGTTECNVYFTDPNSSDAGRHKMLTRKTYSDAAHSAHKVCGILGVVRHCSFLGFLSFLISL